MDLPTDGEMVASMDGEVVVMKVFLMDFVLGALMVESSVIDKESWLDDQMVSVMAV